MFGGIEGFRQFFSQFFGYGQIHQHRGCRGDIGNMLARATLKENPIFPIWAPQNLGPQVRKCNQNRGIGVTGTTKSTGLNILLLVHAVW